MKDPRIYLFHIRDAIQRIQTYTRGGKERFLQSDQIQDAVIFKLAVIGEAVKRLPLSFRRQYREVPWTQIAALRNVVIHEYDSTEIPHIWTIVEHDIPALSKAIGHMLEESDTKREQAA